MRRQNLALRKRLLVEVVALCHQYWCAQFHNATKILYIKGRATDQKALNILLLRQCLAVGGFHATPVEDGGIAMLAILFEFVPNK